MFFAHRGLVTKKSFENSITSLEAAFNAGFEGVEFDLWFVDGQILIKHDQPKNDENLPNLRQYFRFGDSLNYWLDFKNLDQKNAKAAFEIVLRDAIEAEIDFNKIFLIPFETDYQKAEYFCDEARKVFGQKAQFGLVIEEKSQIENLQKVCFEKKIKHLSVFHQLIDDEFVEKFSAQRIFAWTVNDQERIDQLTRLEVKDFATDLDLKFAKI
jgi:glycerophosphoryl diester phosphodiesterase